MKNYYQLLLGLLVIVASLLGIDYKVHAVTHYVHSSTPTIFVHGWGSSSHAEEKMANAARDAGVTKTIVRADVDKKGKVTFNRQIPANAVNPIVEVNLADNKLSSYQNNYTKGYHHGGEYVKNVVTALEKQHDYKQINLVGHSMGNLEIINYINDNVNDKSLPQVAHLVAIAGHYNGLVGQGNVQNAKVNAKTGEPDKMDPAYRELLGLRQKFPKNTVVLNIYGDVGDGSHSDEDVPVNSAKSLKYLVGDRAKSYQEVEIHGKNAQHSKLHNNGQVNRELIKFLWEK